MPWLSKDPTSEIEAYEDETGGHTEPIGLRRFSAMELPVVERRGVIPHTYFEASDIARHISQAHAEGRSAKHPLDPSRVITYDDFEAMEWPGHESADERVRAIWNAHRSAPPPRPFVRRSGALLSDVVDAFLAFYGVQPTQTTEMPEDLFRQRFCQFCRTHVRGASELRIDGMYATLLRTGLYQRRHNVQYDLAARAFVLNPTPEVSERNRAYRPPPDPP